MNLEGIREWWTAEDRMLAFGMVAGGRYRVRAHWKEGGWIGAGMVRGWYCGDGERSFALITNVQH